jgi:hypothetical protein
VVFAGDAGRWPDSRVTYAPTKHASSIARITAGTALSRFIKASLKPGLSVRKDTTGGCIA